MQFKRDTLGECVRLHAGQNSPPPPYALISADGAHSRGRGLIVTPLQVLRGRLCGDHR